MMDPITFDDTAEAKPEDENGLGHLHDAQDGVHRNGMQNEEGGFSLVVVPKNGKPKKAMPAGVPSNIHRSEIKVEDFGGDPKEQKLPFDQPSPSTREFYYAPNVTLTGGVDLEIGGDGVTDYNQADTNVELGEDGFNQVEEDSNFSRKKNWRFLKRDKDVNLALGPNQTNLPEPPCLVDLGSESLTYPLEASLGVGPIVFAAPKKEAKKEKKGDGVDWKKNMEKKQAEAEAEWEKIKKQPIKVTEPGKGPAIFLGNPDAPKGEISEMQREKIREDLKKSRTQQKPAEPVKEEEPVVEEKAEEEERISQSAIATSDVVNFGKPKIVKKGTRDSVGMVFETPVTINDENAPTYIVDFMMRRSGEGLGFQNKAGDFEMRMADEKVNIEPSNADKRVVLQRMPQSLFQQAAEISGVGLAKEGKARRYRGNVLDDPRLMELAPGITDTEKLFSTITNWNGDYATAPGGDLDAGAKKLLKQNPSGHGKYFEWNYVSGEESEKQATKEIRERGVTTSMGEGGVTVKKLAPWKKVEEEFHTMA
jgi:hypothetical protein